MFEEYTSKKLTPAQKRGHEAGKGSAREFHSDKRGQGMESVRPRTLDEIRAAQIRLADMALQQDTPQEWLTDVLEALGLRKRVTASAEVTGNACGPLAGTQRGYEQHLRAYSRPCNMCDASARAAETARLSRLGITMKETGQWKVTSC